MNGGKADLTDYGKSLPSLREIQLQLHALTDNPIDIVVNEDVTVRAESKNNKILKITLRDGIVKEYSYIQGMTFQKWVNSGLSENWFINSGGYIEYPYNSIARAIPSEGNLVLTKRINNSSIMIKKDDIIEDMMYYQYLL